MNPYNNQKLINKKNFLRVNIFNTYINQPSEFNLLLPDILFSYNTYFLRRNIFLLKPFNLFKNGELFSIEKYILENIDKRSIEHKLLIEDFYFKYISNKNEFLDYVIKDKYRNYDIVRIAIEIQSEKIFLDHLDSQFKTKIISNFIRMEKIKFGTQFLESKTYNPIFFSFVNLITEDIIENLSGSLSLSDHSILKNNIKEIKAYIKDYTDIKNNIENF